MSVTTPPRKRAPRRGLPRREQQRLETRQRIFDAALAEFRRVGFAGAQIEDIVEAAGVARGTFYFHFPTKEDVLLELQRRLAANVVKRLAESPRRPRSLKALLQHVVDEILAEQDALRDPQLLRDLMTVSIRQRTGLAATTQPLIGDAIRFFTEAQERGDVRDDLPPERLMETFLTQIYALLLLNSTATPRERRAASDGVISVFIRGIAP